MKNQTKLTHTYTRYLRVALIGLLLIGISLACNTPGEEADPETDTEGGIETAVAQTMTARALDAQQPSGDGDGNGDSPPPPPTDTPSPTTAPPTDTPTPGPTATPTQTPTLTLTPTNTHTPTPDVPMVQVSASTNCRTGPGKVYDQVGVLNVGEEAEIIAKDPQGTDWYIRNPDQAGAFCWIWGQYATTSGDTEHLPVFTPPPTPTPSIGFSVSYHEAETCGILWFIEYRVANTGGIALLSATTTTTDTNTAETVTATYNEFIEMNGCATVNSQNDLTAGESGYVLSNWLSANPAGHNLTASITLCTADGLGGTCVTKNISFTP